MDLHRPLEVGERVKLILNMQITEDVAFLNANKLMDYSLLVGIHNCCDTCEHCVERRPLEVDTDGKVRIPNILNMGKVSCRDCSTPLHNFCRSCTVGSNWVRGT